MDPQAAAGLEIVQLDERLLEANDAALELGLSYAGVRAMVVRGELRVFGRTRRGTRLFREVEVLRVRELRRAKGR